jgi:ATP-dependent DNA helicase
LLNFILPDIFDDVEAFQEWYDAYTCIIAHKTSRLTEFSRFNLPTMQASIGSERSSQLIGSLHAILKPFLLRRLKVDVEKNLPPKKEYVLYAPLSVQQREAYNQVVEGTLRSYLIGKGKTTPDVHEKEEDNGKRRLRKKGRKSYAVDGDDDVYFDMLENGDLDERGVKEKEQKSTVDQLGREHQLRSTCKLRLNLGFQSPFTFFIVQ